MAGLLEPTLTVRFLALGRETTNVKAYSLESAFSTPTDGWEVTLYDTDRTKLRDLWLQPVELLLDGASQVVGRIDVVEQGGDGTAVILRGRDYMADLTECHVDPTLRLKKEMTLGDAVRYAAGPVGIGEVVDDDDVAMRDVRSGIGIKRRKRAKPVKKTKAKQEDYKAQPGEGIFAFLNRLAARQSTTMQPANARSSLVLAAPDYEQEPACTLIRRIGDGTANRILEGTATRDGSAIPSYVVVSGKGGAAGEAKASASMKFATVDVANVIGGELARILGAVMAPERRAPDGSAGDPNLLYRLLYIRDEDSRNQEQVERIALRAFAERFKETLVYRCKVKGHADPETGAIYSVNTIATVTDEVCDIDEPMWIASRRLSYAEGSGATTDLELWRPGAYQIDQEVER